MDIHLYTYRYIYTYIYTYIFMYMYVYMYVCVYVCMYVCTYVCMYIHIYIYIYICIHCDMYIPIFFNYNKTTFRVLLMVSLFFFLRIPAWYDGRYVALGWWHALIYCIWFQIVSCSSCSCKFIFVSCRLTWHDSSWSNVTWCIYCDIIHVTNVTWFIISNET